MHLPFYIARRYLVRQKGTFSSFIIWLAIAASGLSIAVMIVALAIITGFQNQVKEKLFSFWGHVQVIPYNSNPSNILSNEPIAFDPVAFNKIKSEPGVRQIAPFVVRPAILKSETMMEGIRLKGVAEGYEFGKGISFSGAGITYTDSNYSKDIIISQSMANKMELNTGDQLLLCFLEPSGTTPRLRKIRIAGIFHTGMDEVDQQFGICDIRLLQTINSWQKDQINGYQVDLYQDALADEKPEKIYKNYIEPPLYTESINAIYQNIFDWLNMQNVTKILLLTILGIIAVINMAAALIILIVDRAKMLALLKAIGMLPAHLGMVFIYLAGLIGAAGVILGNIIGIGLAFLQNRYGFLKLQESTYYMSKVPMEVVWWQVLVTDIVSVVLCMICMILPSLYIRRISPAKVLQFE